MSDHTPLVSVVVAARNAASTLAACLASLHRLDYPNVEILVVNDGSTDETASVARAGGVRVIDIDTPGRGPSAARNLGVGAAASELVAFIDADCMAPVSWLSHLVTALADSDAVGAGGGQRNIVVGSDREASALDAFFRAASVVADYTRRADRPRVVAHIASCNALYRRNVFVEAGGLREGLFPGEDTEFDYRLHRSGHRLLLVPGAEVEHRRPGSMAWFARWMRQYGRAQREVVLLHGRFRALHYVPLVTPFALGAQLLWWWPATRPVIALADAVSLAAVVGLVVRSGPPRLWPAVVLYSLVAVVQWHRGYYTGK